MEMIDCPVCKSKAEEHPSYGDYSNIDCPKCSHFKLSGTAEALLPNKITDPDVIPLLSHYIRKRAMASDEVPLITEGWIVNTIQTKSLPNPLEQANNLIFWLGTELGNRLERSITPIDFEKIASIIGGYNHLSVVYLLQNMADKGWVPRKDNAITMTLTFEGWERYEALRKGLSDSTKAFMAMPFGHPYLNEIFEKYYVPTVDYMGFKLERVDANPGAGCITNRMLSEIERAKFLVVELTHNNNGAYWEAGYAEGKGKPVIYLCKRGTRKSTRPHFDIRNHQTIFWTEDTLEQAMEDLKAAIWATFPEQATPLEGKLKEKGENTLPALSV